MATVPVSGTDIRFLSGIPFSNDYKNTRWFDTYSEQATWFLAKNRVHSMDKANFQRIEGKHFVAVNKSIDELWSTNYLMFRNAEYNTKWFFGFVTKLEYVQLNRTNVHFEIDVFQTWKFDMKFKPSFVLREHCKLWNSDGSPIVNTLDEGLNYGADYDITSVTSVKPFYDTYYLVMVAKSTMHHVDGEPNNIQSSLNGIPQPLCYYVHPFRMDGSTPNANGTLSSVSEVLSNIFSQENAVNNIVSMYVTEAIGYLGAETEGEMYFSNNTFEFVSIADNVNDTVHTLYVKDLPKYSSYEHQIEGKYNGFFTSEESKLLMYPYCVTLLTDFKGNQIEIKNEYLNSNSINIRVRGSLGLSNKVVYALPDYQTHNLPDIGEKLVVSMEHSLINNNPQDVPIITDMLSAFIQGNKNSLENQRNSIMWNGVFGAISGAIGGGVSGANSGYANTAKQMVSPVAGLASAGTSIVQGAGNTVLQLQGINAKLQDINNVPPQLAKMGSNTAFDFGNGYTGVYIVKKQIKPEYRKKLADFFNMFGYKVNEVKVPNFHTRKYWNYVQTSSCTITGDFNNEDLQELKGVFDNGITLWHTDDIGNYSLVNGVR